MTDDATAYARLREAAGLNENTQNIGLRHSQRFLTFTDEQVLIDVNDVVRAEGLTAAQIASFARNGRHYQSVIFLRGGGEVPSGAVYLNIPFAEVSAALHLVEAGQ